MTYQEWIKNHREKQNAILLQIAHLDKNEIIEYFDFENMRKFHEDFCPLYLTNTKCHDIKELNCYLCGCPYFEVTERKSYCSIGAKDGKTFIALDGYVHQDCSNCTIPHTRGFITKNFKPL